MNAICKRAVLTAFCCSLTGLLMSSCQPGGGSAPYALVHQPVQQSDRIVVLDNNVRDTLFLVNTSQGRLPGGQILVKAAFQNRFQDVAVWADISFEFQDRNGMAVDKGEWVTTRFAPGEVTTIQGSSISPNAHKHVLLLKNLRTGRGGIIRGGNAVYVVQ
jgi:hypothetical protein